MDEADFWDKMLIADEFDLGWARTRNEKEYLIKTATNFPNLPAMFSDSSDLLFYDLDTLRNFGEKEVKKAVGPILASSFSGMQEALIFSKNLVTEEIWGNGNLIEKSYTQAWSSIHKLVVKLKDPTKPEIEKVVDWLKTILAEAEKGEKKQKDARGIMASYEKIVARERDGQMDWQSQPNSNSNTRLETRALREAGREEVLQLMTQLVNLEGTYDRNC